MEASNNMAVHCESVTKSYGTGSAKVTALRGIDLEVYAGELLMLVGPSGCGKTTLISVIAAILDWMMPGIDGVEVCRLVRQRVQEPYIYLTFAYNQRAQAVAAEAQVKQAETDLERLTVRALVSGRILQVVALQALGGLGDHRAGSMKVPGLQLACLGSSPTLYCGTKSRQLS